MSALSLVIVRIEIGASESKTDRSGTAVIGSRSGNTIDGAGGPNDRFHRVRRHVVVRREELIIFLTVLGVRVALTDGFLFIKVIDPFLRFLASRNFRENLFDVRQRRSELMRAGIPLSLIED